LQNSTIVGYPETFPDNFAIPYRPPHLLPVYGSWSKRHGELISLLRSDLDKEHVEHIIIELYK